MKRKQLIERLFQLGHFRLSNLTVSEAQELSLIAPQVKAAVKSYQNFMAHDYQRIAASHHTAGVCDGIVGPVTQALMNVPRCGMADFARAETGSGSWPVGCHETWPDNHAFTVNVDKSGLPSFLGSPSDPNSVFEQAWDLTRLAYADMGIVFEREDGNGSANTSVTFVRGNGWIGLAIVPSNPHCADSIWAKFDNRYSPSALIDQWSRLLTHEFGHNMGLAHSRGGIMNPSIIGGTFDPNEWRGDPSEPTLTRWFGGEPVDLGDPPDPPDPPPTGDGERLRFSGQLEARGVASGKFYGNYKMDFVGPPI